MPEVDLGMLAIGELLRRADNIMFERPELRMDDNGIMYLLLGVKCNIFDEEGHIAALVQFDARILNITMQESNGRRRRSSSQPRSLDTVGRRASQWEAS